MSRLRDLSQWSARKLLAACALWLVGAPVAIALGLVLAGLVLAKLSGKTSIALHAEITNMALGWLFLPPVLLVAAWIVAKSRSRDSAAAGSEVD
jgi:hypothetical protein